MPMLEGSHRRMLAELIRDQAIDDRWAEKLIGGYDTLLELETATIAPTTHVGGSRG
jgi:hypothetical protein